jgi:hypothetical protein
MSSPLPAGPYRTVPTPEGGSVPYYVIPFDKDGACEGPLTRDYLIAHLAEVSDIFIFSHGWNNDWTAATERYEDFIKGFQQLRATRQLQLPDRYRPLLVGIFWPSQSLEWLESETGPGFAGTTPVDQDPAANERLTMLRDAASSLPPAKRERFHALLQRNTLAEGEDKELAALLAVLLTRVADDEAGTASAPDADDLLTAAASLEAPEPDYEAIGTAVPAGAGGQPEAANAIGAIGRVLDPRSLLKPFTVWQMKDRAGTVGANGVAPLLDAVLAQSDSAARVHLIGHSFGCKVVMTAACVMPAPARPVESALLLQAAVSQYAFAANVPARNVAGGFVKALARVKRPIMATFSAHDGALTKGFHLAVRRHDDLGELQFAGTPSHFGALGGFGPQDTAATIVPIKDPGEPYDFAHSEKLLGVDGSRTIGGHGKISNPSTWWAEYCLLTAHLRRA